MRVSRQDPNSRLEHEIARGEQDGLAARPLTVADLDAIAEATARRVAEIVGAPTKNTFAFIGARELACELGVSLDYIYSHAVELGGMRLGSGPRARIRFDLDRARRALETPSRVPNGRRGR